MSVDLSENVIMTQLKTVKYPGFSRDITSFGLVKAIRVTGSTISLRLAISTNDPKVPETLRIEVTEALKRLHGVTTVDVQMDVSAAAQPPAPGTGANALPQTQIPGVKHVIAIASGKGGVGKSTVASNLTLALQQLGYRVGLCDCDIYGPSIAMMFGIQDAPEATEDERIIPIEQYGVQLMSMGFFLDDTSPAILRGPMVTRYTQQFLRQVAWRDLDYLILDLPPGTGDIQLTIVQTVALTGAIVVTTPQEVALTDARKAATMFQKVNVPVLGLIENMSYFLSPSDGQRYDIFGTGGGRKEAARLEVPLLAEIPIEIAVRESGDNGKPAVLAHPDSLTTKAFLQAAKTVAALP
jgi:ATP-binding protein involved in chromosome partitioning